MKNNDEVPFPNPEGCPDKIHVLIADDHLLVADAVRESLVAHGGFRVSLSETLDEALNLLRANKKKRMLVLLDLTMPGMKGLLSIRRVIDAIPNGCVVLFSGASDKDFIWRAIDLGAKGFISKSQGLRSLHMILQIIYDGGEYVPTSLSQSKHDDKSMIHSLSDSDLFILRAVANGKTNKEIALETNRSEVAIKMKMRSIRKQLHARNRAHAVILAAKSNMI